MQISKLITPRFLFLTVLILIAAISRLIPHPPNVTPIAAMALFGGAYFGHRYLAFIVPLLALFFSDIALQLIAGIGFYGTLMPFIYGGFILMVLFGHWIRQNIKITTVLGATLGASAAFFLLSNFGTWLTSPYYPKSMTGLLACYEVAIPFFRNSLIGNFAYVTVMFGVFELAKARYPQLSTAVTDRKREL